MAGVLHFGGASARWGDLMASPLTGWWPPPPPSLPPPIPPPPPPLLSSHLHPHRSSRLAALDARWGSCGLSSSTASRSRRFFSAFARPRLTLPRRPRMLVVSSACAATTSTSSAGTTRTGASGAPRISSSRSASGSAAFAWPLPRRRVTAAGHAGGDPVLARWPRVPRPPPVPLPQRHHGHHFKASNWHCDITTDSHRRRNLNRVAEVWLDEYKELYYEVRPNNRRSGAGDISERVKLKSDLHCKSFKWCVNVMQPLCVHNVMNTQVLRERVPRPLRAHPRAVSGKRRAAVCIRVCLIHHG